MGSDLNPRDRSPRHAGELRFDRPRACPTDLLLERYLCCQLQNSRIVSGGWRKERRVWREDASGRVEVILRGGDSIEVRAIGDVECFKHQSQRRAIAVARDVASNPA